MEASPDKAYPADGTMILLTAPDCHLCGHARGVLDDVGLGWREVSTESPEGGLLAAHATPLRPLLLDPCGSVVAAGRLSARRLRRDLASRAGSAPEVRGG
jgi:hypothetical protein